MALRINASSEYAEIANPWTGGPITIVFWMRRLGVTTARFLAGFIDTDDSTPETSGDPRVTVTTVSGPSIAATYFGAGGSTSDSSSATYDSAGWTQVTAVFDGSGTTLTSVQIYIDGTGTGSPGSASRDLSTNGVLDVIRIGINSASHSNCDFAHFAYYNAALSGSQITELQTKLPTAITGASPVVYESFLVDEGDFTLSGATIDSTNDGTLPSLTGGGDTTAPTLTSPDFTATGATTGTATVSTDEGNGTLFCVITTSATSPSVVQVKAGNDHTGTAAAFAAGSGSGQAVSATGTQTVNVTGLTASTTYYAHFVHTDAAANDSTVSTDATGDTTTTPDTTAPVLSSPVGTTTGATTATVGATTDEGNGTLYVVVTTSATAPSAAQIKAGQDHTGSAAVFDDSQAVSSTGAKTFSATGLTASTAYRAHLIHTDAAANDSNIVTSAEFTTDAAVSSDIRLQPGLYLERGGQAASLTADRWWVFTSDLSAVENTGTALSINSSGQPTIDINSSASYVVGDFVPLGLTVYDEGSDPEDRTVRTFFGWVEAVAQS
jgi:hypothetical protein